MDWKNLSDNAVMEIATPIMDNLMQAATECDYERHVRDFCLEAKQGLEKDGFENQCRAYQEAWGHFTERELLGVVKKSTSALIVWRQWCAKSDDQFIASLRLIENNDHIQVSDVGVS